ncbi:MAG TPA: PHP domain-containing protein, partial [Candidatus Nitrosocosmicus sp.]|nr:PHP domain-containing protein [Candidatus Nitrosocosmicus sp.]
YDIKELWKKGELGNVSGIGSNIAKHLDEYFKDPENSYLVKTVREIPETVFLFMNIPGVGPKKAFKLVKAFNLEDPKTAIEQLKQIALSGRIAELDTFGKKSEEEILASLEIYKNNQDKEKRMPYPIALKVATDVIEYLKKHPDIKNIDVLGSMRRKKETIGDIDLAVIAEKDKCEGIIQYFIDYPKKLGVEGQGDKKASIIATNGMGIDLRVTSEDTYGAMLQYFTGSKEHNVKLREYALKKGLSLNEYGIKKITHDELRIKKDKKVPVKNDITFKTEEKFYNYLGLDYIEPELRDGTDEIKLAEIKSLPNLVLEKDLKGDFHIHSNYPIEPSHDSGVNSTEEILNRALELNYSYIGFSDHNPSMSTHSEEDILNILKRRYQSLKEIFQNKKYKPLDCYIGLEVDILPEGNLALPKDSEKYLDYIIVSIHSRFTQPIEETTQRILKALEFPKVKIFGHPTGRLIEKRDGVNAIWDVIFQKCVEKNIACEINASPYRLDLPDLLVKQANKLGVKFTIDSDSHSLPEMDNLPYGISVARRGRLEKDAVITSWDKERLKNWIEEES